MNRQLLIFMALALVAAAAGPQASWGDDTATVEGVVTFAENPSNKWRYSRYYVKRSARKELAETVVVLQGVKLAEKPAASTVVVDQENFRFVPETTTISAGDTVLFKNSDNTVHNVNCFNKAFRFNVNMPAGGMDKKTFAKAGDVDNPYRLGCIFHSAMRAWVYVFDHPYHTVTTTDGAFKFSGIPAGEYTLQLVHPAGQMQASRKIVLTAGQTQKVDIALRRSDKAE